MKVKLAVLGAGIFSTETYLPLLNERFREEAEIKYIWSRSQGSAEKAVANSGCAERGVVAKFGDDGLMEILADEEVDGALNILPVQALLDVSKKCWEAGKHVLQEKPIGQSVQQAIEFLQSYKSQSKAIWQLAENYRFEDVFVKASDYKSMLGNILKIDLFAHAPMNSNNKYFFSDWRRNPDLCPGGFVYEGGVHFIAGLRLVAEGLGCGGIEEISGDLSNVAPDRLPAMDTAVATLKFSNGVLGTLSISYAVAQGDVRIVVAGSEASLTISRKPEGGYSVTVMKSDTVLAQTDSPFVGIEGEIRQFVSTIQLLKQGKQDDSDGFNRARPEEGIRDAVLLPIHASREHWCIGRR